MQYLVNGMEIKSRPDDLTVEDAITYLAEKPETSMWWIAYDLNYGRQNQRTPWEHRRRSLCAGRIRTWTAGNLKNQPPFRLHCAKAQYSNYRLTILPDDDKEERIRLAFKLRDTIIQLCLEGDAKWKKQREYEFFEKEFGGGDVRSFKEARKLHIPIPADATKVANPFWNDMSNANLWPTIQVFPVWVGASTLKMQIEGEVKALMGFAESLQERVKLTLDETRRLNSGTVRRHRTELDGLFEMLQHYDYKDRDEAQTLEEYLMSVNNQIIQEEVIIEAQKAKKNAR